MTVAPPTQITGAVLSFAMLSTDLETMALGMPGTRESSHFGKRDFRVGKKIFMSLPEAGRAVCKLTPDQQRMLLETEPGLCAAVPGGWGLKGWTSVYFEGADRDAIEHILQTAWRNVAPKSLVSAAQSPTAPQAKSSAV